MRSHKLVADIGVINEGLLRLGKWSKWLSQGTYRQERGKKKNYNDESRNLSVSRQRVSSMIWGLICSRGGVHREDVWCVIFCSLTCVGQIDDREKNHPRSQWHSKKEKGLKLLPSQPVLEILQESIRLQEGKDTCRETHPHSMVPGATNYRRLLSLSFLEYLVWWQKCGQLELFLPAAAMCSLVLIGWKPTNGTCMDSTKPTI